MESFDLIAVRQVQIFSLILQRKDYRRDRSKRQAAYFRGTKRLVSVNICSVEGNSADIFVSKVSPGTLVVKRK